MGLIYAVHGQPAELCRTQEDRGHVYNVFEENRTVAEKLHAKYVSWLNDFDLANNCLDPGRTLSGG